MLDTHHDEIEALRAHQALQWLVLSINRRQKSASVDFLTPSERDLRTMRPDRVQVSRPVGTQHQAVAAPDV